jgi:rhodanese-related sulfurtransferase
MRVATRVYSGRARIGVRIGGNLAEALPYEVTVQETKRMIDAGERVVLIDVREPMEHDIARIEGARLIPMQSVPGRLTAIEAIADEARVIVLCHHGVRSLSVVNWLREQGVESCQSMAGGIESWSLEIDRSVPRY